MALAKNDDVVEKLAPTTTDPAFRDWILPRTPIYRSGRLGAHGLHDSRHRRKEDRVPIEYEVLRCSVVRERLAQLLDYPGGHRIRGDVEVHDSSSAMLDNAKHVEHPRGGRRHGEKSIAAMASFWFRKNAIQRFTLSGSTGRRGR